MISESPAVDETAQFLSKQDVFWKGFLNMVTVAKFVTKGYLVSGSAENLKAVQYYKTIGSHRLVIQSCVRSDLES